jgi:hypothetical protein
MTGSSTNAHSTPSTDFFRIMQQHIHVMQLICTLATTKPNQCPKISDEAKCDMKTVLELLEREYGYTK